MIVHRAVALAVALCTFVPGSNAFAGTTGTLRGTVTDQRHFPVYGAKVTVSSPAQRAQTTTDASGRFTFIALAPGTYVVTVNRDGFGTQEAGSIVVTADASTDIVARVSRLFWNLGPVLARPKTALVQPRQSADVYVLLPSWPFYDIDGTSIYALRFVPGLTFGAGAVLAR